MTALQLVLGGDSVVSGEGTVVCDHTWLVFQSISGSNRSIKSVPSSRGTDSRLVTYTGCFLIKRALDRISSESGRNLSFNILAMVVVSCGPGVQ